MGPLAQDKTRIDMDQILHSFEDGLGEIMTLRQSDSATYSRNDLFKKLSDRIMTKQLYSKFRRKEAKAVGSSHPPTDAQAAAMAVPLPGSRFGDFVPTKPIENKIKFVIDIGLDVLNLSEAEAKKQDLDVLYGFSEMYDAYNAAVETGTAFRTPGSFYKIIEGCEDDTRLLANIVSVTPPPSLLAPSCFSALPHPPLRALSLSTGQPHYVARLAEGRGGQQGRHQCVGAAQAVAR